MEVTTLICDANAIWAIGIVAGLTAALVNTFVLAGLYLMAQAVDTHQTIAKVRKSRQRKARPSDKKVKTHTQKSVQSQVTPVTRVLRGGL